MEEDSWEKKIEWLREYLPPELVEVVENKGLRVDPSTFALNWFRMRYENTVHQTGCNGLSKTTELDLEWGAKLASIASCLPSHVANISTQLHLSNPAFSQYCSTLVAGTTLQAIAAMDQILAGKMDHIPMPRGAQCNGMYIRTPIRIYNRSFERVTQIPSWEDREQLLQHFLVGPTNTYILRKNLPKGYECYVTFRGTTNEFNSLPQYGLRGRGTQVFHPPSYHAHTKTIHSGGSATLPLIQFCYTVLVEDIRQHVFQVLRWLGAYETDCQRIVFAGHSMGAGMCTIMAYLMALEQHPLWLKSVFRGYATPLTLNAVAARELDQWIRNANQPLKYTEVINVDDVVNVQYNFGGPNAFAQALQTGTSRLGAFLLNAFQSQSNLSEDTWRNRLMKMVEWYPELLGALFLQGFMMAQSMAPSVDPRGGTRPSSAAIFHCTRRMEWSTEYIGKAHSFYGRLNMTTFWILCREYENALYRIYHDKTLQFHPRYLLMIPCFGNRDLPTVQKWIHEYQNLNADGTDLQFLFNAWLASQTD
jgi:hypothetical protein